MPLRWQQMGDLRWKGLFWCAPASGIPNAVYLRSRRFGLGNRGVRLKCPSGNDTGAVDLRFLVLLSVKRRKSTGLIYELQTTLYRW